MKIGDYVWYWRNVDKFIGRIEMVDSNNIYGISTLYMRGFAYRGEDHIKLLTDEELFQLKMES